MKQLKFYNLCFLFLVLSFNACSSLSNSLILGGVSGLAVGTYTGSVAESGGDPMVQQTNTATGAALGLGIGALGAYILHKQVEDRLQKQKIKSETESEIRFGELPPNPFAPEEPGP